MLRQSAEKWYDNSEDRTEQTSKWPTDSVTVKTIGNREGTQWQKKTQLLKLTHNKGLIDLAATCRNIR